MVKNIEQLNQLRSLLDSFKNSSPEQLPSVIAAANASGIAPPLMASPEDFESVYNYNQHQRIDRNPNPQSAPGASTPYMPDSPDIDALLANTQIFPVK